MVSLTFLLTLIAQDFTNDHRALLRIATLPLNDLVQCIVHALFDTGRFSVPVQDHAQVFTGNTHFLCKLRNRNPVSVHSTNEISCPLCKHTNFNLLDSYLLKFVNYRGIIKVLPNMKHSVHVFQLCPYSSSRFSISQGVNVNFVNFVAMHKNKGVILCFMTNMRTFARNEVCL